MVESNQSPFSWIKFSSSSYYVPFPFELSSEYTLFLTIKYDIRHALKHFSNAIKHPLSFGDLDGWTFTILHSHKGQEILEGAEEAALLKKDLQKMKI